MTHLLSGIRATAPLTLAGREQRAILMERYDRRDRAAPVLSAPRTGGIYAPAVVAAPERLREVPRHKFPSLHPRRADGRPG